MHISHGAGSRALRGLVVALFVILMSGVTLVVGQDPPQELPVSLDCTVASVTVDGQVIVTLTPDQDLECGGDLPDGRELRFALPWQNAWTNAELTQVQLTIEVTAPEQRLFWNWTGTGQNPTDPRFFSYIDDDGTELLLEEDAAFFDLIDFAKDEPDVAGEQPFFSGLPFTLDCNEIVWEPQRYNPSMLGTGNEERREPALGIDLNCEVIFGQIVFHFPNFLIEVEGMERRFCDFLKPPMTITTFFNDADLERAEMTGNPGFNPNDRLLVDPNLRIAYDLRHLLWTMEGAPNNPGIDATESTIAVGFLCLDPEDELSGGHN